MAKVKVVLFGILARIAGEKMVYVNASTLKEALNEVAAKYGEGLKDRILDERGNLRRFVNIYVNGKDVRFTGILETRLNENDEISIIPAVGGG
ncbi:MAG: ubiquitin-like small modifier protein 1 [Candidatus Bathyarchaeia archaeon]|nr:MoaD family protein [Candidatus Bathyarchaeota archaeon]